MSGTQVAQNAPAPYSAQEEPPQQEEQDAHISERNATRIEQKTVDNAKAAEAPATDSQEPVESKEEPEEHPVRHLEWPTGSGVKLEHVPSGSVSGLHTCISQTGTISKLFPVACAVMS